MSQYREGTASVTNADATVQGSGTEWLANISAGDIFTLQNSGVPYIVASITSDTELELTSAYAGTTLSGQYYTISTSFTPNLSLPYPERGDFDTATILKRLALAMDTEMVTHRKQGTETIWVPAKAWYARTTDGPSSGSTEISGSASPTVYRVLSTLDFDQSNAEYAQFDVRMPKSWDQGGITFIPVWTYADISPTPSGAVVWRLSAVILANGESMQDLVETYVEVTDTGIDVETWHEGDESSALVALGGSPTGQALLLEISRQPGQAGDTLTADAQLIGVVLLYTTNAANDD